MDIQKVPQVDLGGLGKRQPPQDGRSVLSLPLSRQDTAVLFSQSITLSYYIIDTLIIWAFSDLGRGEHVELDQWFGGVSPQRALCRLQAIPNDVHLEK